MVSVSLLKIRQAPIIARNHPPTPRGAAVARHREPGRTRLGAVINCQLLARSNTSSSSDLIRAYVPQVGITTVISEMDHGCGRQDEMDVLVDRQSIDICGRGISLCLADAGSPAPTEETSRPVKRMTTRLAGRSSVAKRPLPSIADSRIASCSYSHKCSGGAAATSTLCPNRCSYR